jgi:hypothetical protein
MPERPVRKVAGKQDRSIQRTRQRPGAALLSLIEEKGFESLTVQDIMDRANLGQPSARYSERAPTPGARPTGRADDRVFALTREIFRSCRRLL